MYTKPYDNSTGIVKMGTKVPETGINLAYIGNSKQEDAYGSVNVINNKEYTNIIPFEQVMYVDGSYKLSTNIQDKPIETDNILVTNVFTETSDNTPLYYFYKCNGTIKKVLSEETAYVGPDIIISPVNKGTGLGGRHKIILTPVGPSSCEITIYTNFISDNTNAYTVSYNKQDGGTTYNTTELLNLDTIFKQVSYDESWPGDYTDQKVYAIKENGSNFDIYVTSNQAEVQIPTVRKEIGFTYKIDALVDGTCSPGLTKTIKTGVIFIKGSPSEAVMDALKKLKDSLPNYIKMVNPHPKGIVTGWISGTVGATVQTTTTVVDDTTSTYWIADPAMPLSHMYDYDLLIYAGAGADTTIINTTMADNIKKYLEAGGNLWIDNNGTLPSTLLTLGKLNLGVSFEYAEATYSAAYNTLDYLSVLSRYGTVDVSKIGFADNENKMNVVFNAPGYEIENVVARYNTASPSTRQNKVIIGRKDKSLIIASSNGILSGIIYNKANAINIASNIMFRLAERKWYTSGDISCSVLNKNSLFDIDYDNSMLEMPYTNGYNTRQESVAFRKIIPNIYEKTKEYLPDIQPNDAVEFYISKKNNDVEIYPVKEKYEKNDIVYAYTTKDTVKWNISNDSDISVSFPKIAVDMTFDTYVCKKDTTNTYVEKTDFASINYVTNQINISQRDGVVDLGYLKIIVAGTKSGLEWSDPSFVYYRIRSGKYTMGEFVEEPLKLNFMIYDEQTGKFFVSKTGDLIISASNVTNSMKLKV
jgi:hypothetical protein